jgi:hypothetical protein
MLECVRLEPGTGQRPSKRSKRDAEHCCGC